MKSDMENKDWINDYKALKSINPVNAFTVPEGYFDNLESRIIAAQNLAALKSNGPVGGFAVPENYFDELAGNIQSRIAIEAVAAIEGTGFALPEGYFNNLTQQIKSRIYVEEILSATGEVFTAPQGYFTSLNESILNKTTNTYDAKRNGAVRKLFASTAFKYATAACFAVFLSAGILLSELTSSANEHKNSFLHKQLSTVPADEIKNYLQLNVDAGDTQQTVVTQSTSVDDDKLKDALQGDTDSVQ